MITRSWFRNLLTTVLARLTRRDMSTARPQLDKPPAGGDKLSRDPLTPGGDFSTLIAYPPQDIAQRACAEVPRPPPEKNQTGRGGISLPIPHCRQEQRCWHGTS